MKLAFVGKVLGGGQREARCDNPFDGRVVGEVEEERRVLYVCYEEEDGRMEEWKMEDGVGWEGNTLTCQCQVLKG